ncbi:hypothetical protein CMK11_16125 [Candidatus Poribacteria bacterium]|nr:hypothetical protein [Candidatus Poribacteria bacterium]
MAMEPDGGNVAAVGPHPASDGRPAWSPDGTEIAFISNRDPIARGKPRRLADVAARRQRHRARLWTYPRSERHLYGEAGRRRPRTSDGGRHGWPANRLQSPLARRDVDRATVRHLGLGQGALTEGAGRRSRRRSALEAELSTGERHRVVRAHVRPHLDRGRVLLCGATHIGRSGDVLSAADWAGVHAHAQGKVVVGSHGRGDIERTACGRRGIVEERQRHAIAGGMAQERVTRLGLPVGRGAPDDVLERFYALALLRQRQAGVAHQIHEQDMGHLQSVGVALGIRHVPRSQGGMTAWASRILAAVTARQGDQGATYAPSPVCGRLARIRARC